MTTAALPWECNFLRACRVSYFQSSVFYRVLVFISRPCRQIRLQVRLQTFETP